MPKAIHSALTRRSTSQVYFSDKEIEDMDYQTFRKHEVEKIGEFESDSDGPDALLGPEVDDQVRYSIA